MMSQRTSIDLFSGCGGLALGLRRSGFEPAVFCEISDDAAATFLANHPETPRERDAILLAGRLETPGELKRLTGHDVGQIDLVCGGPPCQGYSKIGHRRTHKLEKGKIPSNYLFKAMVQIIHAVKPKLFLFENVEGILSGRWTKDGEKGEIFRDVLLGSEGFGSLLNVHDQPKAVGHKVSDRYLIRWRHIQCSQYGVPQNRPRVLVVGLRADCASGELRSKLTKKTPTVGDLIDTDYDLIPKPASAPPWDLCDILKDLVGLKRRAPNKDFNQRYEFSATRRNVSLKPEIHRWYLASKNAWLADDANSGRPPPLSEQEYSKHSIRVVERFERIRNGTSPDELAALGLKTKKFAQRLLPAEWGPSPASITVTSLPDDFVHYAEPRILTVREWARLQTFPDWYEFRGPRTTGGDRRAGNPSLGKWERVVPRYTQIGNAVPVMLATQLGKQFARILGNK